MKKILFITALSLSQTLGVAQDGMDYTGTPFNHYSRLQRSKFSGPPVLVNLFRNQQNEKALGVYQNDIPPVSFLEVNTDNAHMPFPLPSLALSDVFSTNSGINSSFWKMNTLGTEYGQLFNNATNHFGIQASHPSGHLIFNTGGTWEKMRIDDGGYVMIGQNTHYVNAPGPSGGLYDAEVTINAKNQNTILGGISNGANPRVMYHVTNPGVQNFFMGETLPETTPGFFPNLTAGLLWDSHSFPTWQANIHIHTRTTLFGGLNAVSVTRNAGQAGINNTAPQNRLEITSTTGDPYFPVVALNGASGLRLTNLTAAKTPIANPGKGVLSVDKNGDVIYVPEPTGSGKDCCIGAYCTPGPSNPLTGDYEIPFAHHNIYYPGQGLHGTAPPQDAMALGYRCTDPLPAKFNVKQELGTPVPVSTNAGFFLNRDQAATTGGLVYRGVWGISDKIQPMANASNIGGDFFGANASSISMGVRGQGGAVGLSGSSVGGHFESNTVGNSNNLGAKAIASNGSSGNIGLDAQASAGGINNYGIRTTASGGSSNSYGLYSTATIAGAGANIGVFGEAANGPTSVGVLGKNPNPSCLPNSWAGYFIGDVNIDGSGCAGTYALNVNGDANVNGTLYTTTGLVSVSDASIKKNVKEVPNALEILNKLAPKSYDLYNDNCKQIRIASAKKQYGLIAQEVEKVLPEIVYDVKVNATFDEAGTTVNPSKDLKGVNYVQLIAVLIKGVQEQQKQIDELKALVENSASTNPNGDGQKTINSVTLADIQSIILDQNVPNPFAEQTTIAYTLTKDVKKAQILFYSEEGKLINSTELKIIAGKGQLNVFADDLSNGIYTYTLVVDGKIIDSKRMIKNK